MICNFQKEHPVASTKLILLVNNSEEGGPLLCLQKEYDDAVFDTSSF